MTELPLLAERVALALGMQQTILRGRKGLGIT